IRAVLSGRQSAFSMEYARPAPGKERWFRLRVTPLGGVRRGVVVAHMDISENKQATESVRSSQKRLRELIDGMGESMLVGLLTPQGIVIEANDPALAVAGLKPEAVIGLPFADAPWFADSEPVRERLRAAIARGARGEPSRCDIQIRGTGGRLIDVDFSLNPVRNENGAIAYLVPSANVITERKRAETELLWKTAFLEAQVASTIDGILIVDKNGRKILQNPQLADLLRIPREIADDENDEAQRKWVGAMVKDPAAFAEKIAFLNAHPTEVSRDEIAFSDGMLVDRYSSPVLGADGKNYGRIWTFRDITERRRSMDALRASEQRFKALFDQAAVGVAQVHAITGRFTQINQRFCEITGRSREELEALTFADISHPQDLGQSLEIARQIKEGPGREITRENRYVRKDGAALWINLTMSAMWAPGSAPDFLIAVAQDVTSRKKLEEQVQQTQKMEAIGTLAGGIAHDFNNILAAIMGYAELARMKLPDNREVRAYLDAVLQASNRATALVRQILAFSRPQQLERRPVELRSVVTEALGLLRASIPSTIGFKSEFAADTPLVFADATQVHQVLMNLGTNAWHAMTDRPGLLQVTLERCVIDDAHESARARLAPGVYARVSVSDTGTGMDAGRLRRIFDPFFTTKPPGEGTGLGLAVVHGIMAGHEGAVTVCSEPGQGTVFHLYFPAYAGAPGAIVADAGAIPRGEGEQILFIDDEESLARLGGQTLATLGYEVEVATQPSAALALVRASPQRFALVITDQTMPGMTGLDLAGKVRGLRPDLPVILTTGYGLALPAERLAEAGLHQVMLKPVGMRALGIAVHAALHPGPKPPL
ncbi:MAG TPA: PAS domain S-box protein, partial [Rariglobus sp.]